MASLIPYKYTILPPGYFRLAIILAGEGDEPVRIKIEVCDLSRPPKYSALSYCWGDGPQSRRCESLDGDYISVTDNLYQALLHRRQSYVSGRMWIDQICIAQENNEDKAQQVRLMGAIYSKAIMVVVWLGDAVVGTGAAFSMLRNAEALFGRGQRNSLDLDGKGKSHTNSGLHKYLDRIRTKDRVAWRAFEDILRRPWFSRIWTLQEIVLAWDAVIQCGSHQTSRLGFDLCCIRIQEYCRVTGSPDTLILHRILSKRQVNQNYVGWLRSALDSAAEIGYLPSQRETEFNALDNVLTASLSRRATLAHDKIYGVLNIVNPDDVDGLVVDYDIPARDLYIYITKRSISARGDLSILKLKTIEPRIIPRTGASEFPSWVPDYNRDCALENDLWRRDHLDGRILRGHDRELFFYASGWSKASVAVDMSVELPLQAVFVDHVQEVSLYRSESNVLDECSCPEHDVAIDIPAFFSRTPVMAKKKEYLHASMTSRKRYEGSCHPCCKPGDEIWIAMGAPSPFVLRKLSTGKYHFLGEAIIYRIQAGAFLVQHFKGGVLVPFLSNDDREWLKSLKENIPFETEEIILL